MSFELDNILINQILFHMENQEGVFVFDAQKNQIVNSANIDNSDKNYIPLPQWSPKDGYRLMEKFTASLNNPVARQELTAALNKNKGVFRAFRDVLEQYPEVEKIWLKYKAQKIRNKIIGWYNALREEWGLEPVGVEPEDTSSLVLEDFTFKEKNDFAITAENAESELTGQIIARAENKTLYIETLEVNPEYRGLGLGKTLLAKLLEKADKQNLDVSIDVPKDSDFFSRSLLLENFKPAMQRFIRKRV
ncbi:GNAT family N-acetyltransferase [Treponema sp. R80B11-R83G3]